MGVTVGWDDDQQMIIRLSFSGVWTNVELRSAGLQSILMIRSVQHPVYVISDFSSSENVPIGVLWQARELNQLRPSNWEAGITVTQDVFLKNMLELFGLIYMMGRHRRLYVVRTLKEAYKLIDKLKQDKLVI